MASTIGSGLNYPDVQSWWLDWDDGGDTSDQTATIVGEDYDGFQDAFWNKATNQPAGYTRTIEGDTDNLGYEDGVQGNAGTGSWMGKPTGTPGYLINLAANSHNLVIRNVRIEFSYFQIIVQGTGVGAGILFDRCILIREHGTPAAANAIKFLNTQAGYTSSVEFRSCAIFDHTGNDRTILANNAHGGSTMSFGMVRCTVLSRGTSKVGFRGQSDASAGATLTVNMRHTAMSGFDQVGPYAFQAINGPNIGSSGYNASINAAGNDATANLYGGNPAINLVDGTVFEGVGTSDIRIVSGQGLHDVGGTSGASLDIIGTSIPQGATEDIGAFELAAAAGHAGPLINPHFLGSKLRGLIT